MPDDPSQNPESGSPEGQPSTDPQDGNLWGDDAPAYLKGKTKEETLEFIKQMGEGVQTLQQQYSQALQQQQAAQQQRAAPAPLPQVNPEDIISNPEKWQQALEQRNAAQTQAYLAQVAQPVLAQTNSMARAVSQMDEGNKAMWQRWGHEIDAIVNQVPAGVVRTKELYDEAVTVVKGRHSDEIANERAKEIADKMAAAAAGSAPIKTYASGAASVSESDDVWAKFDNPLGKKLLATMGKSGIVAACEKSNTPLADYAEQVANTKATQNPSKGGVWHNRNLGA